MNGEKPKFKPWKDMVAETKENVKMAKQQLTIQEAILEEAKAQLAKEPKIKSI